MASDEIRPLPRFATLRHVVAAVGGEAAEQGGDVIAAAIVVAFLIIGALALGVKLALHGEEER